MFACKKRLVSEPLMVTQTPAAVQQRFLLDVKEAMTLYYTSSVRWVVYPKELHKATFRKTAACGWCWLETPRWKAWLSHEVCAVQYSTLMYGSTKWQIMENVVVDEPRKRHRVASQFYMESYTTRHKSNHCWRADTDRQYTVQ